MSNTFNPLFYRGSPNITNYYFYDRFDYSTYKGRRFGAHSGSSSSDLIAMIGIADKKNILILSLNKEKHGIKYTPSPEIKTEVQLVYQRAITNELSFSISYENEVINNYGFEMNNISTDNFIWLSIEYKFFD